MVVSLLGFSELIRLHHLGAVVLIFVGGFLPVAEGDMAAVLSAEFWCQPCVCNVLVGEVLVCFYNLLLHRMTFGGGTEAVLRFFVLSRLAAGSFCMLFFLGNPKLRREAKAMRSCRKRFVAVAAFGELISLLGVCIVTFSYACFYEPAVVNASEGGLQQIFNLVFAWLAHRLMPSCGRPVTQIGVKIVSFLLVAAGLFLTAI